MGHVLVYGNLLLVLSLLLFNQKSLASTSFKDVNLKQAALKYNKIHKSFSKSLCRPGDDYRFDKTMRNFQGNGFYVPLKKDSSIDIKTIKDYLPLLKEKHKWIRTINKKLVSVKDFRALKRDVRQLERMITKLLKLKRSFEEANQKRIKDKKDLEVSFQSKKLMKKLKKKTQILLKKIPFFLSFRYPINHLLLRRRYDFYKNKEDKVSLHKKNRIYFYRKIVQDGSQNPNHSQNDDFLRMAIDTLMIELKNADDFLSEDLRSDYEYILNYLNKNFSRSKIYHLNRLKEWEKRTQRQVSFYSQILKNKKMQREISGFKRKATKKIKDFVYQRQSKTYEFWKKQDYLMRALFVSETILYNEVGPYDGVGAFERKDVMRILLNRLRKPHYTHMNEKDYLYPYLKKVNLKEINENYPWLNMLFKTGEFSFTYFFIPSTLRLFCPDMSRKGRYLRKENVRIAIDILKQGADDFKATRYFSRNSMKGRINMAKIWSDYRALPERVGQRVIKSKRLKSLYKKGIYQYLYSFKNPQKRKFDVIKIKNRKLAYDPKSKTFFYYRNPHHFRYFYPLNP
ncbi:MAG: hypothetical protein ACO20H_09745 [Bacteriovoracaceae bacterium]